MSGFLDTTAERAKASHRRIVLPEGDDPRTLAAAVWLRKEGRAEPIILGPEATVRAGLEDAGGAGDMIVLDPATDQRHDRFVTTLLELRKDRGLSESEAIQWARDPLIFGALMVREDEADGSVAGACHPVAD